MPQLWLEILANNVFWVFNYSIFFFIVVQSSTFASLINIVYFRVTLFIFIQTRCLYASKKHRLKNNNEK